MACPRRGLGLGVQGEGVPHALVAEELPGALSARLGFEACVAYPAGQVEVARVRAAGGDGGEAEGPR